MISNDEVQLYVSLSIVCLFQMFLPCYYANEIEFDFNCFLQDVIESDWNIDRHDKKSLSLLILRQNLTSKFKISGAKIVDLNLETFLKVDFYQNINVCLIFNF